MSPLEDLGIIVTLWQIFLLTLLIFFGYLLARFLIAGRQCLDTMRRYFQHRIDRDYEQTKADQ